MLTQRPVHPATTPATSLERPMQNAGALEPCAMQIGKSLSVLAFDRYFDVLGRLERTGDLQRTRCHDFIIAKGNTMQHACHA
mmetsp:Transcript_24263/g.58470  ORF Transcript_24263/g.58470 Transcript_24263/m.58470 type:complete len:82 (+) Transcript_24263:209-454(+)